MAMLRSWFLTCAALGALLAGCAEVPRKPQADAELVFPAPPDEPRFYYERSIRSSADVAADGRDARLRRLLTGEGERGVGMAKPGSLAVRAGRLYVSDSVGGAVLVFDIAAGTFAQVGTEGQGALTQPLGLAVDAALNLYVVDGPAKSVLVFDAGGKFQRALGGPKMLARPSGVAVEENGERVYVVDLGGVAARKEEHRVRVFDGRSGAHLFDFGVRGTAPGQFNLPRSIARAPDGRLYVVDSGNFRVQAFDRDGKFLRAFGEIGRFPGNFARPRDVAVDGAGRVYVTDAAFGNMQIFDAEGQLLMFIGGRSERDQPARYMLPSGIAVDRDGRIYMADEFFRRVDVFRPAALKPGEGLAVRKAPAGSEARK